MNTQDKMIESDNAIGNEKISMWSLIKGVIVYPKGTFPLILTYGRMKEAILIVFVMGLVYAVFLICQTWEIWWGLAELFKLKEKIILFACNILMPVSGSLIGVFGFWIIISFLFHLMAKLFGGKGLFTQFLKVFAFTYIPIIICSFLYSLVVFLALLFHKSGFLFSSPFLITSLVLYIIFSIWVIVLVIFATKEVHQLSTGKAIGAVCTMVGAGIVLAGLLLRSLFVFFKIMK